MHRRIVQVRVTEQQLFSIPQTRVHRDVALQVPAEQVMLHQHVTHSILHRLRYLEVVTDGQRLSWFATLSSGDPNFRAEEISPSLNIVSQEKPQETSKSAGEEVNVPRLYN